MITPKYLCSGSKIAIVSPSGCVDKAYVESAVSFFTKHNFHPIVFKSCLNVSHQFAGTEQERLDDFQNALDSDEIDAVFCSRGGYGAIQIIDKLNFSNLLNKPKWILGFSDITNFHLILNKLRIKSIHSQMAKGIHDNNNSLATMGIVNALCGYHSEIVSKPHKFNKLGNAEGEIIGGNLSIIYSLQGTEFEIDTCNKILFIEDLNEYLYHLDRMMNNLKLSGNLKNLRALVVGAFTDMKDNNISFGMNQYEIINKYVREYDYPVCYDFPIGHIDNNLAITEGEEYILNINSDNVILKQK